ncbi:MAG TPA: hypothetical protein VN229_06850 [Terriglobales bacterium]|nr:hypothetical protein [Terriglobales bacterium]
MLLDELLLDDVLAELALLEVDALAVPVVVDCAGSVTLDGIVGVLTAL